MDTYEEKYKDLVKRLNKAREEKGVYTFNSVLDAVAPELKESNDERIRKAIINVFASHKDYETFYGASVEGILSWLEKQGEQKSIDDLTQQEAMDIAVAKCFEQGEQKPQRMVSAEAKETMYDKPAWSEEDENEYNHILKTLNLVAEEQETKGYNNLIGSVTWFRTLKERIQPKQEWSEEDERKLELLRALIEDAKGDSTSYSTMFIEMEELDNWLKFLKDRILPQPKQGWSEEDNRLLNDAISLADECDDSELRDWLKSLKPQKSWKPSDEQIRVCKEVYADILSAKGFDIGTVNGELNRLEEELKKLKG